MGRQRLGRELVLVIAVSLAVLVPGIWSYSLVDPWETHYGEVARNMLADGDLVQTKWPGVGFEGAQNEGFRSKPVLIFWMMAASMRTLGVATDGGYSGELTASPIVMFAVRIPFVLAAIAGLVLMWWMLARLVNRRLAWLALLVVGSTPMFCLISRQAIPDMPMVASVIGALSLFLMAVEDGERPITELAARGGKVRVDARHVVLGLAVGFVVVQAIYYAVFFAVSPRLGVMAPGAAIWLPLSMVVLVVGLWHRTWSWVPRFARRALGMAPITTMRQVYLLGCYFLLGISLLAKGPPGFVLASIVALLYIACFNRWRALIDGAFEIKRGLLLITVVAIPWHVAMFLREGRRFVDEYWYQHILNRAGDGSVDKSYGTFEYYTSQIGHGMWLWAALLPAAIGATFVHANRTDRAGRVRFVVALWAIGGVALFCLIQTKFHHYILPVIPALGLLVAFFLDDVLARRERLHPLYAALGAGIALLICRDLMAEPDRWIEMFIYRYDRPWPSTEPYSIDVSDAFLGLGLFAVVAITACSTRFRRIGVALLGAAGLAIAGWALFVYMPIAGTHWGTRDSARVYYDQRTIYGEKLVYFGDAQLADDWKTADDTRSIKTVVPSTFQVGQPMTVTVQLNKAEDERITEQEIVMSGAATGFGDHSIEVTLDKGERAKLAPLIARGSTSNRRGRAPVRTVDADRLIAWQMYWRGEQFWSAGEIWAWLPEMRTSFPSTTSNADFLKYIGDRSRAPLGRRYFVLLDPGRANAIRALLPTDRAKASFEIIDSTSNKFSLASFTL